MKVIINACFGGFGLSDAAYERLIEWGVPCRKYLESDPLNDGEVIFDRELTPAEDGPLSDSYHKYKGKSRFATRYWDTWTRDSRSHLMLIKLVEEMGKEANGECAELKVIEIPDGIQWHIEEYDGIEHVAEDHRSWS